PPATHPSAVPPRVCCTNYPLVPADLETIAVPAHSSTVPSHHFLSASPAATHLLPPLLSHFLLLLSPLPSPTPGSSPFQTIPVSPTPLPPAPALAPLPRSPARSALLIRHSCPPPTLLQPPIPLPRSL